MINISAIYVSGSYVHTFSGSLYHSFQFSCSKNDNSIGIKVFWEFLHSGFEQVLLIQLLILSLISLSSHAFLSRDGMGTNWGNAVWLMDHNIPLFRSYRQSQTLVTSYLGL